MQQQPKPMDILDELHRLESCRQAITDLICPNSDMHAVNRDALAQLLGYLDDQHRQLLNEFEALLRVAS